MHTEIMLYLVICTMHCVVKFKASMWMICTASIKALLLWEGERDKIL